MDIEKEVSIHEEIFFPIPINIKELKNRFHEATTSGIVPHSEIKNYCIPDTTGFLGLYNLSTIDTGFSLIGTLTVFVTGKPEEWHYDNNSEEFAGIMIWSNKIKIWNEITVGSTKNDILGFIGNTFHYTKGQTLFCELGDYHANFTIIEDTVARISINKNCK